ncbi:hypothetical protein [Burkholderia ubonensis]|uniref:hypothetical protein n=1 Tax=Burkholderia ubonensis TaxID=101571 RepID=UPI0012F70B4C|nr:hypothetical protein [Burkholderia ubonensis]
MALVKLLRLSAALALIGGTIFQNYAVAGLPERDGCISPRELSEVSHAFFGGFPSAGAMIKYSGRKALKIDTNVADGVRLEREGASNEVKVDWLVGFLNDRHDYFSDFSEFEGPSYTYMRNGVSSIENLRTTRRFPKNQCVQEVNYDIRAGMCIRGQKLQSFSISFVKEGGDLYFSSVEIYFMGCRSE